MTSRGLSTQAKEVFSKGREGKDGWVIFEESNMLATFQGAHTPSIRENQRRKASYSLGYVLVLNTIGDHWFSAKRCRKGWSQMVVVPRKKGSTTIPPFSYPQVLLTKEFPPTYLFDLLLGGSGVSVVNDVMPFSLGYL